MLQSIREFLCENGGPCIKEKLYRNLLYKSSLKAESHRLLADQWDPAFETTTSMRKQGGSLDSEDLFGFRKCEARRNPRLIFLFRKTLPAFSRAGS